MDNMIEVGCIGTAYWSGSNAFAAIQEVWEKFQAEFSSEVKKVSGSGLEEHLVTL